MNQKGWILLIVALSAGCGVYHPPKRASRSSCKLSQQDLRNICLIAAKEKKLIPVQVQRNEKAAAAAIFRFNYSVQMPNGETAAATSCEIDAAHNSVIDAQLLSTAATSEAADYMHEQGLCAEWKLEGY
jgi:hypothetical protein